MPSTPPRINATDRTTPQLWMVTTFEPTVGPKGRKGKTIVREYVALGTTGNDALDAFDIEHGADKRIGYDTIVSPVRADSFLVRITHATAT